MSTRRCYGALRGMVIGALLWAAALPSSHAEVVLDGAGAPLPGPAVTVQGDFGNRQGSNLFQSFSVFNVFSGESVTYTLPTGASTGDITNLISRVTGGTSTITGGKFSFIDGPINGIAGANFWFINPNGIIFGNNAALNTASSFHFSTADYLKLGDNGFFYANPSVNDVLTVAAPSAFGFLSSNPAPITVGTTTMNILQPPQGATLSLVGGPINIGAPAGTPGFAPGTTAPGYVLIENGRVNLVSVASAGEATFDSTTIGGPLVGLPSTRDIHVDDFAQLGDINIRGGVVGNTFLGSAVDAKEISIRGGRLVIGNPDAINANGVPVGPAGSLVRPGFFSSFPLGVTAPNGGEVSVKVTDDVTITGTVPVFGLNPGIRTFSGSQTALVVADIPRIAIEAGSVSLRGTAVIRSDRFGPNATAGNAPDVHITTGSLDVRNGASIAINNYFQGSGGILTIDAQDMVLDRQGSPFFTGLAAQSFFHPAYSAAFLPFLGNASGGTITVNVNGDLTVRNGAEIDADSFNFGPSGNINVTADNIFLSRDGANSGFIAAQSLFAGNSGSVDVNATGRIEMKDGFAISATTGGSGSGGLIDVSAGQSINISGTGGGIFSATLPPPPDQLNNFAKLFSGAPCCTGVTDFASLVNALGLDPNTADIFDVLKALNSETPPLVPALPDTPGPGGKITVSTPQLTMEAGTRIDSSTLWDGNAGEIIAAVDNLSLSGGARISSRSGAIRAADNKVLVGTGNAGDVTLTDADTISISGTDSAISTSTFGDGDAGSILLSANQVDVQDGGSVTSESGGTLAGQFLVGTGNAGTVTITATGPDTLTISGAGSTVSTTTSGAGAGGDISLASAGDVNISKGGSVTAEASSTGDAGIIGIAAADLLTVSGKNSTVSTTTSGAGDGGSISLSSAGDVQILGGGSVSADSLSTDLDAGDTGDITITADNSITLSNGTISTQAVQADGGNIKLTAPNIVRLTGSEITTSIFKDGGGNGGNINIDPQFVLLNTSKIIANAFTGSGGNIQITADNFIPSSNSVVDASSQFGVQGTVVIQSPENDIAGSISQLPQSIVDVSGLLPESCAARHAGGRALSSFVVAGRGGLPTNPDNYLPSFGAGSAPVKSGGTITPGVSVSELGYTNQTTVAMAGWDCLP
jgi:filamentous hemagglutinin family protein